MTDTKWRQCELNIDARLTEAICDLLWDAGASGVEIADDETRTLPGESRHSTNRATIKAPFAAEAGLEGRVASALQGLQSHFDFPMDLELTWNDLELQDWNACFKSEWKSFSFLPDVLIVPSWEDAPPNHEGIILHLDPGMAFGTGIHETTKLCAMAIQHLCRKQTPTSILDVGTGTGILSILGLKMGIPKADATDIDPMALEATRENAERNGVGGQLTTRGSRPSASGEKHPLVVANILATPLMELAPDLAETVLPQGILCLSGILVDQEERVRQAFHKAGFEHRHTENLGDWIRIDFMKA